MSSRSTLEKRIEKERQKVINLQREVELTEAFIQGLQEALKMLPQDGDSGRRSGRRNGRSSLRPGSDMAKIQKLLKEAGKPLHITEILTGVGKPNNKPNRLSITGSMGRYVRNGEIFKRVGPNLFSLIDMDISDKVELPPDFGAEEIRSNHSADSSEES